MAEEKSILVVGGGISGITAAVEAAETGCKVYLVEKLPYLGGHVARMNEYFPKLCPPYCGLEINFKRIRNNPRITVITSTEVMNISGEAGNFSVSLGSQPEYVSKACTACGDCSSVCPVEGDDPFNLGMAKHKAISLPHELAYPARFYIDDKICIKPECDKCAVVCGYDAINLKAQPSELEINVGTILYCTGWEAYDASNLTEYSWGESPDVITNLMMERLGAPNGPTKGQIHRPSDGKPAGKVAFLQCAGSRDENHLPYCSAVCCSASLKQAVYFTGLDAGNRADIYYIDLRVSGRNEDFLKTVEHNNDQIRLIKGKASGVKLANGRPVIEAENISTGKKTSEEYDLVVLATGIVPNRPTINGIIADPDGFIARDELERGFSAGGCCHEPKDVAASVRECTGLVINALHKRQ